MHSRAWRGDYLKSTVQLMKEMAADHNVLYIDYAYSWKDVLVNSWRNSFIPVSSILGFSNPIERVAISNDTTIDVLSLPPIIPYNWINNEWLFDFVQKINRAIVSKRISGAIKKLNIEEPCVVNAFNPYFDFGLFKTFNPRSWFIIVTTILMQLPGLPSTDLFWKRRLWQ